MKIETKFDVKVQARASLDDAGNCEVFVSATAVYDEPSGGTTTVRVDASEADKAAVGAALTKAVESAKATIGQRVLDAIHVSREVGKRQGEIKAA